METYQERIRRRVDEILPELSRLSDDLWNNPEYNFKEYFACKSMSALLEKYGFARGNRDWRTGNQCERRV